MATFVKYFYPEGQEFVKEVPARVIQRPGAAIACQFFDREEKDGKLGRPINVSEIIYIERERGFLNWLKRLIANF